MNLVDNKRSQYVMITGATSGFGLEFARLFAQSGYQLILVDRSTEKLQDVALDLKEAYGALVIPITKDLSIPVASKEVHQTIKDLGICVNILVNDAGQGEYGKFIEYDIDRDIDIIQVNITSLVSLTKLFLKDMIARNEGKILQVSSFLGKYPTPLMAVYASTKAFALSFAEGLIDELKDTNITITALLPGVPDTSFFYKSNKHDTEVFRQENLAIPEEVAKEGYLALMNGESKIISGFETMTNYSSQAPINNS